MGTGSFPEGGGKRPGLGADHPPPSKRRGHERVRLYLYSSSGPSWPVIGGGTSHRTIGSDGTASNSELGLNLPSIRHAPRRGSYKETREFDV